MLALLSLPKWDLRYLLDTNVCVRFLNGESERLRQRFLRTDRQDTEQANTSLDTV